MTKDEFNTAKRLYDEWKKIKELKNKIEHSQLLSDLDDVTRAGLVAVLNTKITQLQADFTAL